MSATIGTALDRAYDPDACPYCGRPMIHQGNRWVCSRRACRCIQEGFKGKEWKSKAVAIQGDLFDNEEVIK